MNLQNLATRLYAGIVLFGSLNCQPKTQNPAQRVASQLMADKYRAEQNQDRTTHQTIIHLRGKSAIITYDKTSQGDVLRIEVHYTDEGARTLELFTDYGIDMNIEGYELHTRNQGGFDCNREITGETNTRYNAVLDEILAK